MRTPPPLRRTQACAIRSSTASPAPRVARRVQVAVLQVTWLGPGRAVRPSLATAGWGLALMGTRGVLGAGARHPTAPRRHAASSVAHATPWTAPRVLHAPSLPHAAPRRPHAGSRTRHAAPRTPHARVTQPHARVTQPRAQRTHAQSWLGHVPKPWGGGVKAAEARLPPGPGRLRLPGWAARRAWRRGFRLQLRRPEGRARQLLS